MHQSPPFSYRFLSLLLFFLWLALAIFQAIKYRHFAYLVDRLALNSIKENSSKVWFHAASVGEINLIKPLCDAYLKNNQKVLVTCSTITGLIQAKKHFGSNASCHALAIDFFPLSKLFARLNIQLAVIAETELWPETLYQIAKKGTPLIHINARLSSKSLNRSSVISLILKTTLSYFQHHFVRYNDDRDNFIKMSVPTDKISVMGNLKYVQNTDLSSTNLLPRLIDKDYVLCASTHDDEECLFAKLLAKNQHWPLLVIAPRHPQRAQRILQQLKLLNLNVAQRSKNDKVSESTDVYLSDTLGEMMSLFDHAKIVVMGGSFVDVGGHNILEPAARGACIITGPSDNNIKQDIVDLIEHKALFQVDSIRSLSNKINTLLENPHNIETTGKNAQAFLNSKQHLLEHYLIKLADY